MSFLKWEQTSANHCRDTMNTDSENSGFRWNTSVQNYEDFQNELDNTANGIGCLKELFIEFHKFEV